MLRVIAVDRAFHFLLLGALSILIFAFFDNEDQLREPIFRALSDLQNGLGGPEARGDRIIGEIHKLFSIGHGTLRWIGVLVALFAIVELYELSHRFSPLKVITLVINLAVVVYLIYAKRLFGVRGGGAAEAALHERDAGWPAIERATPA